MIHSKDLMIGDWVYAIDGDRKKHPCRIATLEYDSTNKKGDFSIDFYGTDYEVEWPDVAFEVEPIPITPEILEKNGFMKCDQDTDGAIMYELGDEILGVDVWVNTEPCLLGGWRTWTDKSQSYSMIDELPISFVHELQHAMRLCGIEKEIMV